MSETPTKTGPFSRFHISLDVLAVAVALLTAAAVRAGLLKHVPW
jgi:hypothetical protein